MAELAADLSYQLSLHLEDIEDYAEAQCYLERALEIRRQVLGPQHPDTGNSLGNLGMLLYDLGDLNAAQPYLEQALTFTSRCGEKITDIPRAVSIIWGCCCTGRITSPLRAPC